MPFARNLRRRCATVSLGPVILLPHIRPAPTRSKLAFPFELLCHRERCRSCSVNVFRVGSITTWGVEAAALVRSFLKADIASFCREANFELMHSARIIKTHGVSNPFAFRACLAA